MTPRSMRALCVLSALIASSCGDDVSVGSRDGGVLDAGRSGARIDECGNGIDDDRNGRIDDGCACAAGETQTCFSGDYPSHLVGACRDGVQRCEATEFGEWGSFSCMGEVLPAPDVCDGIDNDCDGATDEDCECTDGASRRCGDSFVTPPCSPGVQTCRGGRWSLCEGARVPSADVCTDTLDNDCDGTVNEGCACVSVPEVCGDAIDNDCDGTTDEVFCTPPPGRRCTDAATLTEVERSLLEMPADSWRSIPGTALDPWCRAHGLVEGGSDAWRCGNVVVAWGGGVFDTSARSLVLFGGGAGNYTGNEVYGFDIAHAQWRVIRPPTPLAQVTPGMETYLDGSPSSRDACDAMVYLPDVDRFMTWGGGFRTTWLLDRAATWSTAAPFSGPSGGGLLGFGSDYDEATHTVFTRHISGVFAYDVAADRWRNIFDFRGADIDELARLGYRRGVIVPRRRLFFAMGGLTRTGAFDVVAWNIETNTDVRADWPNLGESSALRRPGVGISYDSAGDAIVAWSGGAPDILDLTTHAWTVGSSVGAPTEQVRNGTFGRFRYIEYLNVFVLVNEPTQDVYFYKHTAGCGR